MDQAFISLIVGVATIGGFMFGYDSGLINGTQEGLSGPGARCHYRRRASLGFAQFRGRSLRPPRRRSAIRRGNGYVEPKAQVRRRAFGLCFCWRLPPGGR
ncbi:hypothetical protein DMC47_32170 [Nostoc sp. 3335mG]|nr:hypothetical protein DMC47_32170 [Nostoc sp. 3335mG]